MHRKEEKSPENKEYYAFFGLTGADAYGMLRQHQKDEVLFFLHGFLISVYRNNVNETFGR